MNLPNFIIIGGMKAGTTVLYQYLKQHPQIYMSPVKETNFFVRDCESLEEYQTFFQGVSDQKAIGEASPSYLDHPNVYRRIAHYLPEVKLIAILRNPADRAYSHFFMKYRQQLHGMNESEVLNYCTKIFEEDRGMLKRGLYYRHLQNYFNLFQPQQIKICLYDDLKNDPDALLQDIFQFIDVDEYHLDNFNTYYNKGGITKNQFFFDVLNDVRKYFNTSLRNFFPESFNKKLYSIYNTIRNKNLAKQPKLPPENRQQLIKVYREDILKLQDFIGRDLSMWLE